LPKMIISGRSKLKSISLQMPNRSDSGRAY
jgi:hypothetical protein